MRDTTFDATPATLDNAVDKTVVLRPAQSTLSRSFMVGYSSLCYLLFQGVFLYLVGFVSNLVVPVTIDGTGASAAGPWGVALTVNLLLLTAFGVQHSGMARAGFKRQITRFLPEAMERSTYVLVSSLMFVAIFALWQPMPQMIWQLEQPVLRGLAYGAFAMGWALVLLSTFLLSHFELFGLKQTWNHLQRRVPSLPTFKTPAFYRWVRHPLMTGFLIAMWATPDLSVGRALFAAGMTAYILVGTRFEEKDLVRLFGETYRRYQKKVPAFFPNPWKRISGPKDLAG